MVYATLALAVGLVLPSTSPQTVARAPVTARRDFLVGGGAAALAWASGVQGAFAEEEAVAAPPPPPPPPMKKSGKTASGLIYEVVKEGGKGDKPVKGDLIAIRFKCVISNGKSAGAVIDDIMNSADPYYYRTGTGVVVPAVEEAVLNMRAGDVWELTVPPELGFGTKGRSSSPGKPRIPGDAILKFTLQLDGVPGKDEEILEANGIVD